MDAVLRASAVYLFLVVVFSAVGRRPLMHTTNFDLLFIIIIGQSTQLALLGDDFSVTNAYLLVVTLLAWHLGLAFLKDRAGRAERWLGGGLPLIVAKDGQLLERRAARANVGRDDILQAARLHHGIERFEDVRYAVVERNGDISVIPRQDV